MAIAHRKLHYLAGAIVAGVLAALPTGSHGGMEAEAVGRVVPRDFFGLTAGTISPDGTRTAFTEWEHGGGRSLWLLDFTDGSNAEPRRLAWSAGTISAPAWSVDGASLVYADDGDNRRGLWRFDLLAGSETRILAPATAAVSRPRITADGRVTFLRAARRGPELWVASIHGGDRKRLATLPAGADWPVLSPDGRQVAFVADDRLMLLDLADGGRRLLASGFGISRYGAGPFWTVDGDTLLLAAIRGEDPRLRAWAIALDSGEFRRAERFDQEIAGLSLTRDGRVLFAVNDVQTTIGVVDLGRGALSAVDDVPVAFLPVWTPDGNALAATAGLWARMRFPHNLAINSYPFGDRKNGNTATIVDEPGEDYGIAWSPDGRWIAFHSHRYRTDDVYIRAADGGPVVPVSTFGDDHDTGEPHWSPDGRRLVFSSAHEAHQRGSSRLWVAEIDPETGEPLSEPVELPLSGFEGDAFSPRFSPDGTLVSFHGRMEGSWACDCLVPSEGGDVRVLARFEIDQGYSPAAWSPDGRHLYSARQQRTRGPTRIWRIDVETGESEPVTPASASTLHPEPAPDGERLAVTIVDAATEYRLSPPTGSRIGEQP